MKSERKSFEKGAAARRFGRSGCLCCSCCPDRSGSRAVGIISPVSVVGALSRPPRFSRPVLSVLYFPFLSSPAVPFPVLRPPDHSACLGRLPALPPPCCPSPGASAVRILLVVSDSPGCPDRFGCFVPPFIWTVAFRDRNRACLVRPCRALSGRCPAIRRYFCRARPCTVNPVQKRSCGVRTSDSRGPANRPSPPSGGDRKKFS